MINDYKPKILNSSLAIKWLHLRKLSTVFTGKEIENVNYAEIYFGISLNVFFDGEIKLFS